MAPGGHGATGAATPQGGGQGGLQCEVDLQPLAIKSVKATTAVRNRSVMLHLLRSGASLMRSRRRRQREGNFNSRASSG
jgi:hypothetical protein